MNEKVTKRWVDCLNSMLFGLNVKKNLDGGILYHGKARNFRDKYFLGH